MRSSASSSAGASSAPEALDRRRPASQRQGREEDAAVGPLARMAEASHEQVVYCRDAASGLRAIIAIHDTTLGPALGGTRMWPYRSELEALTDVLRLSEGMTYKAAVTGLNLGGGKAVILGDPTRDKSEALLRAHGRFVDSLGGRYITAEDVGITVADVETMAMETRFVTGVLSAPGGSGDPGPATAFGVYHGIRACATRVWGAPELGGRRVAIQGAGSVGSHLARHLAGEDARLWVSDLDAARARRVADATGAVVVDPEAIFDVEADVFAPCALGAVVNDATIPRLRVRVVAGAANNQLAEDRHGDELARRGILYAPDFVINAGGLINVYLELQGYDPELARSKARGIYDTLLAIFERAEADAIPTHRAAERLAEARIRDVGRAGRIWTPRRGVRPRRFADL